MTLITSLLLSGSLAAAYDIRTVQELLGHQDISTTMIYTHVLNRGGRGVRSPVDRLPLKAAPAVRDTSKHPVLGRPAGRPNTGG